MKSKELQIQQGQQKIGQLQAQAAEKGLGGKKYKFEVVCNHKGEYFVRKYKPFTGEIILYPISTDN